MDRINLLTLDKAKEITILGYMKKYFLAKGYHKYVFNIYLKKIKATDYCGIDNDVVNRFYKAANK